MSKKNRHQVSGSPVVDSPTAVIDQPAPEPAATEPAPVVDQPAEPAATEPASAPVYWVNPDRAFQPSRGFETILYRALTDNPLSEAEVVGQLLASGEYHRVAPQAASLRPIKPVRYCLKYWTAAGILRRNG